MADGERPCELPADGPAHGINPDPEKISAPKPGTFQPGFDERRNTTKPGPGRPSTAFRTRLRSIIEGGKAMESVAKILDDPDHRHFAKVLPVALAQAYGNPAQPVTGEGGEGPVEIAVTHEVIDPQRDAA